MGKLIYSLAMSQDGKIAGPNDDLAWLEAVPNPTQSDFGFADFYASIGAAIMGYGTYRVVQEMDVPWPYADKSSYVVTSKTGLTAPESVQFIHTDVAERIRQLKAEAERPLWLVGGGKLATYCLQQGLIDECHFHIMPILLGGGPPAWPEGFDQRALALLKSETYANGVVALHYRLR